MIYDPNGHLAIVWKLEADGRIRYIDAHPDNSLTRGFYDRRFVRASPGMGAGFKNWRPLRLVDARLVGDGTLVGGHMVLARNDEIPDFALTQFFGTGRGEDDWRHAAFALNGQEMDHYDYVRAALSGGRLRFDPVREVADMVASNCADLGYRADAVTLSLAAGLQNQPEPGRLPPNIYGTDGDWETYSTPSRDARLKTAFKELRDAAPRASWACGKPVIRGWPMTAGTWQETCWRPMTAPPRPAASAINAATARGSNWAMRRRAGGCLRCPSIPINAWSGGGARAAPNSPPAATVLPSVAGMRPSRVCATRPTARMRREWISPWTNCKPRLLAAGSPRRPIPTPVACC